MLSPLCITLLTLTIGTKEGWSMSTVVSSECRLSTLLPVCAPAVSQEQLQQKAANRHLKVILWVMCMCYDACSLVLKARAYILICLTMASRPLLRVGLRWSFSPICSMK